MIEYRVCCALQGCVLVIYWGRVLRMAHRAKKRSGRAANLIPAEQLGRWLRLVWGPLVVFWVAYPFVVAAAFGRLPAVLRPAWPSISISILGLLISGLCLAGSRICWKAMGKHWRMGLDPSERTALIIDGPLAVVRHPIYALSIAMMIATCLMVCSPAMLGVGACHIGLLIWESRREDRHLLRIHGAIFEDYRRRTGGYLPRFGRLN